MTETIDETTGEITTTAEVSEDEQDDELKPDDELEDEEDEATSLHADEPPATVTEDLSAQHFDKAIKRAVTYMKAVPEILGESAADLAPCPRCTDFLPGWILPLTIKPVDTDQKLAVKLSIGELTDEQYKQSSEAFTCAKCDGFGKVATGSHVQGKTSVTCQECMGRGWVGPLAQQIAARPPEERQEIHESPEAPAESPPLTDMWGRPRDHPGYMIFPYEGIPADLAPPGWQGPVS